MGQKRKPTGANAIQQGPPKKARNERPPPSEKPKKANLVFDPRPDWHAVELPLLDDKEVKILPPQWMIDALYERAEKLLQDENTSYNSSHLSGSSSHKFLSTIMTSGTLEDKISALTLLVQESPVHTMKAFDNLLGLSKKKSRDQALLAVAALKDLLGQGTVLPPDRKLRSFSKQPGLLAALQGISARWKASDSLPGGLQNVHLLTWAYEDWLKKKYFELLQILESWCGDEVAFARSRAVTYVWELLKDKPEQEENLLRLLVNKLGDTDRKIASRASYLLLQLETTHPAMKAVITNSIEADCLFRPGQSTHAKYYAIVTLNQTILSGKEQEVANKLLEIYFSMFVQLLNDQSDDRPQPVAKPIDRAQGGGGKAGKMAAKKRKAEERTNEADAQTREKLLAQVLTGVNRAFPFADTDNPQFVNQIDTLFRVTHSANFNTAIQALMLLQQISSTKHYGAERFYRTLYESLLDPRLASSSKQTMYLNLLYKSLKADVDVKRVQAFVKRLLQIVNMHDPPFICSVLYLISELSNTFPSIKKMITEAEVDEDDGEEHFVDVPEEGEDATPVHSKPSPTVHYDARKRDPSHAHAELSALWDLVPIPAHFHPSVAVFAQAIQGYAPIPPKPDPAAHSLMHFLDRFVYRNPKSKASAGTHGSSIMQPLAGSAAADLLVKPSGQASSYLGAVPVNSEAFWAKKVQDVAPDQIFFHSYFNQTGNKKRKLTEKAKKSKSKAADSDEEDEEAEDEIWQAIANSRPEVEGPESDDDLSMGDLEEAYSDSEAGSEMGIDLGGDNNAIDHDLDTFDETQDETADLSDNMPDLDSGDEEALYGDDDEVAIDLDESEAEDDAPQDNRTRNQNKRKEKKKFKQLPTFASAEDYAKLLADEPDDV
ncbi:hypothetical protein AMS68_007786 [Peltaster fructicola]|uniref:CCAAT-binding factor domain-containing protein n=1 Tax=Peltaster fructicola TaxID=286661 RepID=A0A6H0Y609_9PEZI|nr:hypothetical protein AMS68_007786 [Peltaster fructicola]